ncbi:hypothetical protein BGX27_001374 [Mortierella sp. AM989]|nr:hypothetical protein BGX27_001374 [Mortierella sp. AM989]
MSIPTPEIKLFCVIDGESTPFSVHIKPDDTIDDLKVVIKNKKAVDFAEIDPDKLTLHLINVPSAPKRIITLDNSEADDSTPEELNPTSDISEVFTTVPLKKTIHILVQKPVATDVKVADSDLVVQLRKQLSYLQGPTAEINIIVKPEKKVAFTWETNADTATLDDLNSILVKWGYIDEGSVEDIYLYSKKVYSEIKDNDILRSILKNRKFGGDNMVISLESPNKSFSEWKFNEVCERFGFPGGDDPDLQDLLPEFSDITTSPLDTAQSQAFGHLVKEIEARNKAFHLSGSNEATRSQIVASFLVWATTLFHESMFLAAEKTLTGRRGRGPVDYSVHARKNQEYTLSVTEVKKESFKQGIAQNVVQLDSALAKKRKRQIFDETGDDEDVKAYGIVTDAEKWYFLECTMDADERTSFKMSKIQGDLDFSASWTVNAMSLFGKLIWLFTQMQDQIQVHDNRNRTKSNKKGKTVAATNKAGS